MPGRVLLLGYNPPQLLSGARIEAAHYRTWQFLEGLLAGDCRVLLYGGARGEAAADPALLPIAWRDQVVYSAFVPDDSTWRAVLQQTHDNFNPDCIVAVNFSHALYATTLRTDRPVWMDIYGDTLTIQQAAMYRAQSNRGLDTTIWFMNQVARAGDHYSVCSVPQKHMLVGQLSMAGRLDARTFGHDLVDVIEPGVAPTSGAQQLTRSAAREELDQSPEAFVVLWCGGYNTWTDVDTLYQGLEQAMRADARVHFVSIGASTYEAADNQYERLLRLVDGSPYRERFDMRGWQPWETIPRYYAAADVGISIDALHYETIYGTRTRLLEMIGAGLPVLTSLGSELSYILQERGAALTFEPGDAQILGEHITGLVNMPNQHRALAEAATRLGQTELSFAATTGPLRRWIPWLRRTCVSLRSKGTP